MGVDAGTAASQGSDLIDNIIKVFLKILFTHQLLLGIKLFKKLADRTDCTAVLAELLLLTPSQITGSKRFRSFLTLRINIKTAKFALVLPSSSAEAFDLLKKIPFSKKQEIRIVKDPVIPAGSGSCSPRGHWVMNTKPPGQAQEP